MGIFDRFKDKKDESKAIVTTEVDKPTVREEKHEADDLPDTEESLKVLKSYCKKGGFKDLDQAKAFMYSYKEPPDKEIQLESARQLPKEEQGIALTRLSTNAYLFRYRQAKTADYSLPDLTPFDQVEPWQLASD